MLLLMEQDNAPEMFDCSANSTFLKAIDVRGGDDSRQVRVLGEGLKTLRDSVSLGNWNRERAAALCHRGGSEGTMVRNAAKGGLLMIHAHVECCRSEPGPGKRL